jgi:hypothetical protein
MKTQEEFVIKPLSDFIETYDGYSYYNPQSFHLQCVICWNVLDVRFDRETQTAKIYKCTKEHSNVRNDS